MMDLKTDSSQSANPLFDPVENDHVRKVFERLRLPINTPVTQ